MKHAADYDTAGSSDGDTRWTKLSKHACGSTIALHEQHVRRPTSINLSQVRGSIHPWSRTEIAALRSNDVRYES